MVHLSVALDFSTGSERMMFRLTAARMASASDDRSSSIGGNQNFIGLKILARRRNCNANRKHPFSTTEEALNTETPQARRKLWARSVPAVSRCFASILPFTSS
jgi:hypothetical protein